MATSIKLDFDEELVSARPIPEYILKTEKELGSYTTPTPPTRAGTTDGFSYFIKSQEIKINNEELSKSSSHSLSSRWTNNLD